MGDERHGGGVAVVVVRGDCWERSLTLPQKQVVILKEFRVLKVHQRVSRIGTPIVVALQTFNKSISANNKIEHRWIL